MASPPRPKRPKVFREPSADRVYTHEFDTQHKARFFKLWDTRPEGQTLNAFLKQHKEDGDVPKSWITAKEWIRWRDEHGVTRRLGAQSMRGYASRLDIDEVVETMTSGPDPIREHDIKRFASLAKCSESTIRRRLRERTPRKIIRSKQQDTTGLVSHVNDEQHVQYAQSSHTESVGDSQSRVHGADEA